MARIGILGRRIFGLALTLGLVSSLGGCFSEQSYPMVESRLAHMDISDRSQKVPARDWTVEMNRKAAPLLPADERRTLTQDDFDKDGRVTDVWKFFGLNRGELDDIWTNFAGIQETARVASPAPEIDGRGHIERAAWKGFRDVQVPVGGGATLYARLGAPDPRHEIPGSYIVFTHGLFGSLDGVDTINQVEALRRAGHHVLAVEMRGHGETNCEHPDYTVSFGVKESCDFLAIADWLKKTQGAKRVGLVGFSLTGYEALLTAWLDGAEEVNRFENMPLLKGLHATVESERRHQPAYNAGMFIVSPPVDIISVADSFDRSYDLLEAPCKATFQGHVRERMKLIDPDEEPTGNMWGWVASEFRRGGWMPPYHSFAALKRDLVRFIDLRGDDWNEGARRMANIREPVLVLAAANDPLGTAQSVADLFSRVKNPNIGVIITRDGGHMGFPAVSADYYYSLMINFFDPQRGPGERSVGQLAKAP